MHKSIIFLLGLLMVMLLPFGTGMNIFSTANAIAESEYYTDQYMGYADDMVNYYEDESSYANNDGYGSERDRSSYENNNYYDREEYPSYKSDYNSEYNSDYQSYENKDYKSKDKDRDSNSVSISKINCNSVNYNVVGNVTGDNNIGNDGREEVADSNGALGANTYGERYNDGYQKDNGISCQITNNNTIVTGGGNATNGNGNIPLTCEECFDELTAGQLLSLGQIYNVDTLEGLCLALPGTSEFTFVDALDLVGVSEEVAIEIVECLERAGIVFSL